MSKSCCETDDKSPEVKNISLLSNSPLVHSDNDGHDHDSAAEKMEKKAHTFLISALGILIVMLVMQFAFNYIPTFPINFIIYVIAWLLAGMPVLNMAFRKAKRLDFFNEFFLMSIATIGAFAIGAYSEGVAVMVFYSIGEWFQDAAVSNAKKNIRALLDVRPDAVTVMRSGSWQTVHPSVVVPGEVIQVKAGEKVALDGVLASPMAALNTAALTGESKLSTRKKGEVVLAGMINLEMLIEVTVTTIFSNSKLSRILALVQDATARKSKTQLFISKFAKVYTPIVFALALLVIVVPYFIVVDYSFRIGFIVPLFFWLSVAPVPWWFQYLSGILVVSA